MLKFLVVAKLIFCLAITDKNTFFLYGKIKGRYIAVGTLPFGCHASITTYQELSNHF